MDVGMKRKLVVLAVAGLLFAAGLPVAQSVDSDVTDGQVVQVRASSEDRREQHLSSAEIAQLQSILERLQENPERHRSLLPTLLNRLEDYGLIENAEGLRDAMMKRIHYPDGPNNTSLLNAACLVVGQGTTSTFGLLTPAMLLFGMIPRGLLLYMCQLLRPRLSFLVGGWGAYCGEMQTFGMLGRQGFSRGCSDVPAAFLFFGFTGLWISFPAVSKDRGFYQREYFVGSALAVVRMM